MTPRTALPTLRFPKLHADWHIDVGFEPDDWPRARQLAAVPLPHLSAQLRVRLHRDGTWWSMPWLDQPVVIPWTEPFHTWGDTITGIVRTRLVACAVPAIEETRQACHALRSRLDTDNFDKRTLGAALSLTLELEAGGLHDRVEHASHVFDQGLDDDPSRAWMECIFELRTTLEELSMRHDTPTLIDALARADLALNAFGSSVLLVGDERYERLTRDLPVDEETWWGKREALARRMPEQHVRQALSPASRPANDVIALRPHASVRGDAPRAPSRAIWRAAAADRDVTTLVRGLRACAPSEMRDRFASVLEALDTTPCPWLRHDVHCAVDELEPERGVLGWRWEALREAVAPAPGRVPILLYLPERHDGVLLELRIARGHGGLRTDALMPVARDAIRRAHAAVAASTDTRQPRFALEDHTIDLVGPTLDELSSIDGTSLALPAALAFASVWLDRPPCRDLAATGGLEIRPDGVDVMSVGMSGLDAKQRALGSWARPIVARLLVGRPPADAPPFDGVERIAVSQLNEALDLADLRLAGRSSWAPLGDQATRVAELERMFHELRTQDLTRHRLPGANPWAVLADRIQLLAGSLVDPASEDPRVRQADAYAALARAHAGDMEGVGRLPEIGVDPSLAPGVAAVSLLSSLVRHIGAEQFEGCDSLRRALDEKLAVLHATERRSLLGMIRGTQGRSFLHDRRFDLAKRLSQALPLLEESVTHQERFQPVETARSRIYLAMALRAAGRIMEAGHQLDRASRELEVHSRPWSGSYYQATRAYWLYERARLDVVMARPAEALERTQAALDLVDDQGFWPAMGILRTRAWAFRSLGDQQNVEACLEKMRALAKQVPASTQRLMARILEEAAAQPVVDGEVY